MSKRTNKLTGKAITELTRSVRHPEAATVLRVGGLLPSDPPADMLQNIGRRVRFTNPICGTERDEAFTIVDVQYDYRRELCYRVEAPSDFYHFGRPAHPSKIEFID